MRKLKLSWKKWRPKLKSLRTKLRSIFRKLRGNYAFGNSELSLYLPVINEAEPYSPSEDETDEEPDELIDRVLDVYAESDQNPEEVMQSNKEDAFIYKLPTEILDQIMEELSPYDALCAKLSCAKLYYTRRQLPKLSFWASFLVEAELENPREQLYQGMLCFLCQRKHIWLDFGVNESQKHGSLRACEASRGAIESVGLRVTLKELNQMLRAYVDSGSPPLFVPKDTWEQLVPLMIHAPLAISPYRLASPYCIERHTQFWFYTRKTDLCLVTVCKLNVSRLPWLHILNGNANFLRPTLESCSERILFCPHVTTHDLVFWKRAADCVQLREAFDQGTEQQSRVRFICPHCRTPFLMLYEPHPQRPEDGSFHVTLVRTIRGWFDGQYLQIRKGDNVRNLSDELRGRAGLSRLDVLQKLNPRFTDGNASQRLLAEDMTVVASMEENKSWYN